MKLTKWEVPSNMVPENVLLDILDSDRSKFVDNYLGFPLDLSNVIFVATANSLEPLSPILQDRLDIVELPPYTIRDKKQIVKGYIWPKLIKGVSNRAGRY